MPWTIYRYILRELLRVLVLSTTVLCVVIGFAATIKPLADGLLGPLSLLRFMGYLMPTMLVFALPFSAAFSSTLVLSRLASDNEVLACRACGMSYAAILLPIFALGMVLTGGIFFLSNWVLPDFYLLADREIQRDVTRVMVTQINKRQPVRSSNGDMVLYADAADDSQPPVPVQGPEQPYRMILLRGVVVSRLNSKTGESKMEATAELAQLLLFQRGDQTWTTMQLRNVTVYNAERGELVWTETWDVPGMQIPNLFKDKLQFLSWPRLRELGEEPERFDTVRQRKRRVAETMAVEELLAHLESSLSRGGPATREAARDAAGKPIRPNRGATLTIVGSTQRYLISAPRVQRVGHSIKLAADGSGPVVVETLRGTVVARRTFAQSGTLSVDMGEGDSEPLVKIELQKAEVEDTPGGGGRRGAPRSTMSLPRGQWPEDILRPTLAEPIDKLIDHAARKHGGSAPVAKAINDLCSDIAKLGRRINARLHERASSALGCLTVLMLGAVMSLHMRNSSPLVVYFWAFLLATVAIIIARSGENLTSGSDKHMLAGLIVIWCGNALNVVIAAGVYWLLSRN